MMATYVHPPPLTIQQRLAALQKRTGLNLTELAVRAGLKAPNNLRTVMGDLTRKTITSEQAYKLAYTHKVSYTWMSTGIGSPDDEPPKTPWPELAGGRIEEFESWPDIAQKAIAQEKGKLDWAVMAVGELLGGKPAPELTVYFVLSEAEKIARRFANDFEERQRLDAKLRDFMAEHAGTRAPRDPDQRSGKRRHGTDPPTKT